MLEVFGKITVKEISEEMISNLRFSGFKVRKKFFSKEKFDIHINKNINEQSTFYNSLKRLEKESILIKGAFDILPLGYRFSETIFVDDQRFLKKGNATSRIVQAL